MGTDNDVMSQESRTRIRSNFSHRINAHACNAALAVSDGCEIEHRDVVIASKKWACRVFELIADIRLNARIKASLKVLESDLNNGRKLGEEPVVAQGIDKVQRVFQILKMDVEKAAPVCLQLLANPAMRADQDASYDVLLLVLRLCGQRQELVSTLNNIQIITEPNIMMLYCDCSVTAKSMTILNIRLAACEHTIVEAMHQFEKCSEK